MAFIVKAFSNPRLFLGFLAAIAVTVGCSTSGTEAIDLGANTYQESCASCHGDPVTGEGRAEGFALAPVHGPSGHTWHHADGQLLDLIQGRSTYPNRIMPKFEGILSDADVMAVLEFLKVGWTEEQLTFQQEVSANWEQFQG